ncbi:MAG: hypothetical protein ACRDMV_12920 [Streptosporangiales bacterium]
MSEHDTSAGVFRQLFTGPFVFGIAALPLTLAGRVDRAAELRRRLLGLPGPRRARRGVPTVC